MSITALIMTFNGMEYLPYALQSIYNFADEIIICDGIIHRFNLQNIQNCKANGGSVDKTDNFIKNFKDKDKKIKYKVGEWEYEKQKRQYMLNQARCDWIMTVDTDEVYKSEQLKFISQLIKERKDLKAIWLNHYRFCLDFQHCYRWGSNVFQKRFAGCKLYGLRDIWFHKNKVFKYPFHESKNITRKEFDKSLVFPNENIISCYHYSNVCTKEKAEKKRAIAEGLGHNISKWWEDWFGVGISKDEYYRRRNIFEFKEEHPEIMKKHSYYKNPPGWCLK